MKKLHSVAFSFYLNRRISIITFLPGWKNANTDLLVRHGATALTAEHHGCEVHAESALREISYGHWEGRTRDEIEREFSLEYDAWQEDPLTVGPQGGESGIQVLARSLPVIRRIEYLHLITAIIF